MKKTVFLFLIMISLLSSCDITSMGAYEESKIYMINIGLNYEASGYRVLTNARRDGERLNAQLKQLASDRGRPFEAVRLYDEEADYRENGTFLIEHETDSGEKEIASIVPTRDILQDLLDLFTDEPDSNDILIFTYSGHGIEPNGDLFILYDMKNTIPLDEIRVLLDTFPGYAFAFIDSCFNGGLASGEMASTEDFEYRYYSMNHNGVTMTDVLVSPDFIRIIGDAYSSLSASDSGRSWVISSSTENQESWDYDFYLVNDEGVTEAMENGAATYHILKYLGYDFSNGTPAPSSGQKTVQEMYRYIRDHIAIGEFQTPQTDIRRSDLILFD